MHEEVEPAYRGFDFAGQPLDLIVARDVAGEDQRLLERRRQLAHVFLEAFARIRQNEPRAGGGRGPRDRP